MTVSPVPTNPEKLFAYLEGRLAAEERAQLEAEIANDPQLQRQLEIAREMHQRSHGSREVLGESPEIELPTAGAKLGKRVAAAFSLLVLANVLVGIAFIVGRGGSKSTADLSAKESAIRQQLTASLQRTAETALPAPTLETDEIRLIASPNESGALADNVVMFASQYGGSATKAPPDETGVTILANLPAVRADEFRQALAPLTQADFPSPVPPKEKPTGDKKINIYVRITHAAPSPGK